MSDTRDTLPTGGESFPAETSPNVYPTTPAGSTVPPGTGTSTPATGSGGGMETAKQEAANVAGTAKDEAVHVARTAGHEAKQVGREARSQFSHLYDQTRVELSDQAAHRQTQLAQGLRSASDELHGMASSTSDGGVATDVVRQAAQRLSGAASWLDARDPGAVLNEVKRYARRRPMVFLGVAALAGVVVGRLTRSLAAGEPESDGAYTPRRSITASSGSSSPARTTSTYGATGAVGDTPVYDASSAGRSGVGAGVGTGAGVGSGAGFGGVTDAADDPSDPLFRNGENG